MKVSSKNSRLLADILLFLKVVDPTLLSYDWGNSSSSARSAVEAACGCCGWDTPYLPKETVGPCTPPVAYNTPCKQCVFNFVVKYNEVLSAILFSFAGLNGVALLVAMVRP